MFVNAVTEIATDLNWFDKIKFPCAVYDQKDHTFDTCPALKYSNIPQSYLKLLPLGKQFVCGLRWLDPAGRKHHHNSNVVCKISLAELDALETLENSPIHTVSSIVVRQKDQLTEVSVVASASRVHLIVLLLLPTIPTMMMIPLVLPTLIL